MLVYVGVAPSTVAVEPLDCPNVVKGETVLKKNQKKKKRWCFTFARTSKEGKNS